MNSTATPIYEGQDFYVPTFEVTVGSRALAGEQIYDITQVIYKDSVERVDSFEITINNWDAKKRTFKYSDDHLFDPGQRVTLKMGYRGTSGPRLMLTGKITDLRATFPSGGQPTLVISGLSLLQNLRSKQESQAYYDKKDSEIAQAVASRMGIQVETPNKADEIAYPYVLQANQNNALFLLQRAHRAGYEIYVKEEAGTNGQPGPSTLFFGSSTATKRQTYVLDYGSSLVEFQPTLKTNNQVGTVRVHAWDSVHKRLIEGVARRSGAQTHGVGSQGGEGAIEQSFSDREEVVNDRPVASQAEADRLARDTLERISKEMVTASLSTVGLPELRAGIVIIVTGVGTRFSGRYFVKGSTHTIGDSGYTTQLDCRREELN